jgi:hypothetical protein
MQKMRNAYKTFAGEPEVKRPLGRPKMWGTGHKHIKTLFSYQIRNISYKGGS